MHDRASYVHVQGGGCMHPTSIQHQSNQNGTIHFQPILPLQTKPSTTVRLEASDLLDGTEVQNPAASH